ncbi:MAG: hypothetical protein F4X97_14610 [Boseongicola sp. SB0662_bin_57]|nr:hypothetical protein [Boseongicola sp. SB0662_bin_57]
MPEDRRKHCRESLAALLGDAPADLAARPAESGLPSTHCTGRSGRGAGAFAISRELAEKRTLYG